VPFALTAAAAAVTAAATPVWIMVLRRLGVIDTPTGRSSHVVPVPRGGGVVPAAVGVVAILGPLDLPLRFRIGVAVAIVGFGAIGLCDDFRSLAAAPRLALQSAVAIAAVPFLLSDFRAAPVWAVAFALGAALFLTSYVNAFNFMDGINGIAAMQATVAGIALSLIGFSQDVPGVASTALVLVGVALGFLPFNYPTARVFLGDVGSYAIGGWIGSLVIAVLAFGIAPESAIGVVALWLADTGTTLLRRVRAGKPFLAAHREHTYQRLVQHGWTQTKTAAFVTIMSASISATALLSLTDSVILRVTGDVAAAALLLTYLRSPELVAQRASNRGS
jgi:UDP-GlcNAc:undecaprenyl-phosphate/decaprenyl-phosphate GlcNAc-1-phosphate transferase